MAHIPVTFLSTLPSSCVCPHGGTPYYLLPEEEKTRAWVRVGSARS